MWLLLNNLLVDPKARAKYDMDDYRKEAVLRVRRHLNDILLDQLPILRDLQRVLDELTMGVSSQPDESQTTRLIIEQVLPRLHPVIMLVTHQRLQYRLSTRNDGHCPPGTLVLSRFVTSRFVYNVSDACSRERQGYAGQAWFKTSV